MRYPFAVNASFRLSWLALLIGALVLRAGRAVSRWDEVAVAYAAYQFPVREALTDWARLPSAFVGLHPPLYGVLHGLVEATWPSPLAFMALSVLASLLAVVFVGKVATDLVGPQAGLCAAGLAATAPVSLHYAAEWNNYPLLLALIGALYWAWGGVQRDDASWWRVAFVGVLLGWTHLLGGLLVGGVLIAMLFTHRRAGIKALLAVALGTLPVVISAIRLVLDGSTFNQPEILVGASLQDFWARFGVWPWLVGVFALVGAASQRGLALQWLYAFLCVIGMVGLSIAAPHQFPYWTVLMPLAAVLAAAAPEASLLRWNNAARIARGVLWGVVFAQGFVSLRTTAYDVGRIQADLKLERAIDVAIERSQAGDAIWLISPALEPDDDKRAISTVLWRLPFGRAFPAVRPFDFDYTDYQFGQPRDFDGRVVYTFTDFWADRMDSVLAHHLDGGHSVWVVLYDHGPAHRYPERLEHLLRPWKSRFESVGTDRWGLGVDRLAHVTGRVERSSR